MASNAWRQTLAAYAMIFLASCGPRDQAALLPPLAQIPAGRFLYGGREAMPPVPLREVEVSPFFMGRYEVTIGDLLPWLNEVALVDPPGSVHLLRRGKRFSAARGARRLPASGVSRDDAESYCRWLSAKTGRRVRLPTEIEWEYAARGGIEGARYPWGWGPPEGRAVFAAREPRKVGSFSPNGFGLYDMAGNLFEWCAAGEDSGEGIARGGSWSERDPRFLRVYNRVKFSPSYRGADVGFRIVVEDQP